MSSFLKIFAEYNIVPQTNDSRFKTFLSLNTASLQALSRTKLWLGQIDFTKYEQLENIKSFHVLYLSSSETFIPDVCYLRDDDMSFKNGGRVEYYDYHGVLPRLYNFYKENNTKVLFLFEQHVRQTGSHKIMIIMPPDPTQVPGLYINPLKTAENKAWMEQLQPFAETDKAVVLMEGKYSAAFLAKMKAPTIHPNYDYNAIIDPRKRA